MADEAARLDPGRDGGYGASASSAAPAIDLEQGEVVHEEGSIDSVYSLVLMVPPVMREIQSKRFGRLPSFSMGLVLLNFVMQFALLVLVQGFVVKEEKMTVESVIFKEPSSWRPWEIANNMIYKTYTHIFEEAASDVHGDDMKLLTSQSPAANCHRDSLCSPTETGRITCAPPSLQLLGNWALLDVDGDGLWSEDEASDTDYRGLMKCRFGADPMVLFTKVIADMTSDTLVGKPLLHPNITQGTAIHKAYFDYFLYKPVMCIYGDPGMCANMFTRGVFHEAIAQGRVSLTNATAFCTELLATQCEHLLPSTYHSWKIAREEACGKHLYTPVEYASPDGNPDSLMVRVDFENRLLFGNAAAWHFILFRSVIMVCFLGSMLNEVRDMYRNLQALRSGVMLVYTYDDEDNETIVHMGERTYKRLSTRLINGKLHTTIDPVHRGLLLVVLVLRAWLWVMLLHTGILFLGRSNSYLDLIFDAVSLVFIFDIDEFLYGIFVRDDLKTTHENIHIRLPRQREAIEVEFVGILIAAVFLCWWHAFSVTQPIKQALDCVCLWEGSSCTEAEIYSPAWWDQYWDKILPASQAVIKQFGDAAAVGAAAPAAAAAPAPAPAFVTGYMPR